MRSYGKCYHLSPLGILFPAAEKGVTESNGESQSRRSSAVRDCGNREVRVADFPRIVTATIWSCSISTLKALEENRKSAHYFLRFFILSMWNKIMIDFLVLVIFELYNIFLREKRF